MKNKKILLCFLFLMGMILLGTRDVFALDLQNPKNYAYGEESYDVIAPNKVAIDMSIGDTFDIKITNAGVGKLQNYTIGDFLYEVEKPDVVSVGLDGKLTAKKAGTSYVTISTKDRKYSTVITVYVDIENYVKSLFSNLKVEYYQYNNDNLTNDILRTITNKLREEHIEDFYYRNAELTEENKFNGDLTITTEETHPILLENLTPTFYGFTFESSYANLTIGGTSQLVIRDGDTSQISGYFSADEEVATISENGEITAVAIGYTEVGVIDKEGNYYSIDVSVSETPEELNAKIQTALDKIPAQMEVNYTGVLTKERKIYYSKINLDNIVGEYSDYFNLDFNDNYTKCTASTWYENTDVEKTFTIKYVYKPVNDYDAVIKEISKVATGKINIPWDDSLLLSYISESYYSEPYSLYFNELLEDSITAYDYVGYLPGSLSEYRTVYAFMKNGIFYDARDIDFVLDSNILIPNDTEDTLNARMDAAKVVVAGLLEVDANDIKVSIGLVDQGKVKYIFEGPDDFYYYAYIEKAENLKGFHKIGNKTYYLDENGSIVTGLQTIDGEKYYFGEKGLMLSGVQTIEEEKYFFGINSGKMMKNLINYNGATYYGDPETGALAKGVVEVDGDKYFFGINGRKMMKGIINHEDKTYYADSKTGVLASGMTEIKGNWYYFDEETNEAITGEKTVDGLNYYFDPESHIRAKGVTQVGDEKYFYGIGKGKMMYGIINYNGATYYADKETGVLAKDVTEIDGKKYFFGINGRKMMKGIINHEGKTYYADPTTGVLASGMTQIGNDWYYFDETTNEAITGERTVDELKYYFDPESHIRAKGVTQVGDEKYFYGIGKGKMMYGIINYNGATYYANPDTGALAKDVTEVDGKKYFFGINGRKMMKGLINHGDKTYYANPTTGVLASGMTQVGNDWYYFDEETNEAITGEKTVGELKYYFDATTKKRAKGVTTVNDEKYFYGIGKGKMMYGIINYNGATYYANPETGALAKGVTEIDGKKYFFGINGRALMKKNVTWEGVTYVCNPVTGVIEKEITEEG